MILTVTGCVSPPGARRIANPVIAGRAVSLENILVAVTSSAGDLTAEKNLLGDALVSGLNQTEMFASVSRNRADLIAGNGITIRADIKSIKRVSDDARAWTGALAGSAQLVLRVSIADLQSGQPIEFFDVEGRSGASAYAGTTDEAIQEAVRPIVAEVLKLNSQTSQ